MRLGQFKALTRPYVIRPLQMAHIQTDGSFSRQHDEMSRTAIILKTWQGNTLTISKTYFDHTDSTESEWCSVLDGIMYAVKKGQPCLELENDNIGVIRSLVQEDRPKRAHIADYYNAIQYSLKEFEYLGVRWIPRKFNKADRLFRV